MSGRKSATKSKKGGAFKATAGARTLARLLDTFEKRNSVIAAMRSDDAPSLSHINHLCHGTARLTDRLAERLAPAVTHVTGEHWTPAELLYGKAGASRAA